MNFGHVSSADGGGFPALRLDEASAARISF